MTGAFALAGWHFSRNPTSSSSENPVARVEHSEPWKTGGHARYQYHPGGDPSRGKKDAPSALNEVIIPNVNLPKVGLESVNEEISRDTNRRTGATREVQQMGQGGILDAMRTGAAERWRSVQEDSHNTEEAYCAIER